MSDSYDRWEHGAPAKQPADPKKLTREQIIEYLTQQYHKDISAAAADLGTEQLRAELVRRWKYLPRSQETVATILWRDRCCQKKSTVLARARQDIYRMLRQNDPYTGLYECSAVVQMYFGDAVARAFEKTLPETSNAAFGNYDFVVFAETNDVFLFRDNESTSEVVIFNPALQRIAA